jgi:hypothetical protein
MAVRRSCWSICGAVDRACGGVVGGWVVTGGRVDEVGGCDVCVGSDGLVGKRGAGGETCCGWRLLDRWT